MSQLGAKGIVVSSALVATVKARLRRGQAGRAKNNGARVTDPQLPMLQAAKVFVVACGGLKPAKSALGFLESLVEDVV